MLKVELENSNFSNVSTLVRNLFEQQYLFFVDGSIAISNRLMARVGGIPYDIDGLIIKEAIHICLFPADDYKGEPIILPIDDPILTFQAIIDL